MLGQSVRFVAAEAGSDSLDHSIEERNSAVNQVVFSVLLFVYLCINIPASVLVWRRRNVQPLKARHPKFLVFFNCVAVVITMIGCVNRISPSGIDCIFLNSHLSSWYFCSFAVRAAMLWFKFRQIHRMMLSRDKTPVTKSAVSDDSKATSTTVTVSAVQTLADLSSSKVSEVTGKSSQLSSSRDWTSAKYINLYGFLSFCFCFIGTPISFYKGECFLDETPVSDLISTGNNLILLVVAVALAFKLRSEYDHFWLKQEFLYCGILSSFAWGIWIILPWVTDHPNRFAPTTLVAVLLNMGLTIVSCVIPVYLSYKKEWNGSTPKSSGPRKESAVRRVSKLTSISSFSDDFTTKLKAELVEVLEDQQGFALLEDFLIGEFNVATLLFYKAHQRFLIDVEDATSDDKLSEAADFAEKIFESHIRTGAKLEVNVPNLVKEFVESELGMVKQALKSGHIFECKATMKTLFTSAVDEAITSLASDSFSRFKLRPESIKYFESRKC